MNRKASGYANTAAVFVLWAFAFALAFALAGCGAAAPDASKAYSRGVIKSGGIVAAEDLRVAEYLNYYKQSFPEPTDSAVGLDLRLGNQQLPASGGEAWLQIGMQARSAMADRQAGGTELVAPLNLALVIDRSGSMADGDKMPYLKESLRVFLESLQAEDRVAIVAYDNNAELVLPSQPVGNRKWLAGAIERLEPQNRTNLYDGLMMGFEEVARNFDVRRNNRVILLTDGIANQGVTDPERIAADAKAYNDKGIYLATIGLGHDFNDKLLSRLANQGHGAYHFIDSAQEMDKVFRNELTGMLQKSAGDVSVVVQPGPGVRVLDITGFDGQPPAGPIEIKLRDMGTGDSQVVLAHLSLTPGSCAARTACQVATVELRYTDLFAQRPVSVELPILGDGVDRRSSGYDPLQDVEVLRNVTIQESAQGLKEIDRLYKSQRYQAAWELACRLERDLRRVAALTREEQMVQDAELMRSYQATLARWVQQTTGHSPVPADDDTGEEFASPVPASGAPAIEIQ